MKNIFLLYCLMFSLLMFSQNKIIIPKSGTIVFIKEEKFLDKNNYLKSYKELMPKIKKSMTKELFLERLTDGKSTDTVKLKIEVDKMAENLEMMLPYVIEEDKKEIRYFNEFNRDTITKYNDEFNNVKIINQVSDIVVNEFNEHIENIENEIIKLTEFVNETKIINGYNCFKVIYNYNEPPVSDFDFIPSVVTNTRELWVTKEIKCNYHPVINESEILKKYYPLEIKEYSKEIMGFETIYKLKIITIK